MLRFRRMRSLQKFAAVHASNYNFVSPQRSLQSRPEFKLNRAAAVAERRGLGAAKGAVSLALQGRVRVGLTAPLDRIIGDTAALGKRFP